jgi:hypothetical protein
MSEARRCRGAAGIHAGRNPATVTSSAPGARASILLINPVNPKILRILVQTVIVLQVALGTFAGAATAGRPTKKLIEFGWDQPDTVMLRRNGAKMEATTPFDGVIFAVRFQAEGKLYTHSSVFSPIAWKREWLAGPLADLKACHFRQFTDNFIRINADPGTLDWADDAAWAATASNAAQLAWLAKATGTKGICFDPEAYMKPQFQWDKSKGLSFAESAALARKRGAQLMRAMAQEYPKLTFFGLYLFSLDSSIALTADLEAKLKTDGYGLWPAFVNGLLDGAPRSVRLVDAAETTYGADGRMPYVELYRLVKNPQSMLLRLLAPENRSKYARQVSSGFGFFLNCYVVPPGSQWYIAPHPGETRLQQLQKNLQSALEVADEYVWIYGEKWRWWDTGEPGQSWEEALPGIAAALSGARAAADQARTAP